MFSMLLVVGSLVPASDSPADTVSNGQPAAKMAIDGQKFLRDKMTMNEVLRVLGSPSCEVELILENPHAVVLIRRYPKVNVEVTFMDGKVIGLHRIDGKN